MNITVAIPSRNRSYQLLATIRTLQEAESGKHRVVYIIGADADDPQTIGMGKLLMAPSIKGGQVTMHVFERTGSLGAMVNQMALDVPADAYCSLCDDVLVRTEGWDEKIAEAVERRPDGVFWWKTDDARPATYAIVTEKWRAAAGCIFTEHFPFWWDDIWLLKVWTLASEDPWLHVDAWLEDRPSKTQNMRDLRFWGEFYLSQKGARVEQANRIAAALGWPRTLDVNALSEQIDQLTPEFLATANDIEASQGESDKPAPPSYVRAKARAEALMQPDYIPLGNGRILVHGVEHITCEPKEAA